MKKLDWTRLLGFSLLGRGGDADGHGETRIGRKVGDKGGEVPVPPPSPPPLP